MYSQRYYNLQPAVLQCTAGDTLLQCTARGIALYSHRYYNVQPDVLQCTAGDTLLQCTARGTVLQIIASIIIYSQRNYIVQPEVLQCTTRGITMYSQRYYNLQLCKVTQLIYTRKARGNNSHMYM
jgi:hypothetical protein